MVVDAVIITRVVAIDDQRDYRCCSECVKTMEVAIATMLASDCDKEANVAHAQ